MVCPRCPTLFRLVGSLLAITVGTRVTSGQSLTRTEATITLDDSAYDYALENAFPELSFDQPLAIVSAPGETDRLFVVEKTGRIQRVTGLGTGSPTKTVFLDLSGQLNSAGGEQGLLALAFHPQYATNRHLYVWLTTATTTAAGSGRHNRLARFTAASDGNSADAATQVPLISQYDQASNHNGGELMFGPDGYLYVSLGDEGGANDQFNNSQRIDRDFFAGLLRLDVDQRAGSLPPNPHPAVHAGTYAVPPDNPWVGATTFNGATVDPADVRTEFWAVGLRNPWRFAFDSATGRLWLADVGQGAREEINVVTAGGNYGWAYREGTLTGPDGNPPTGASLTPPVWEYPRSQGISVTGGVLYRGSRYPALAGRYVFADFGSGRLWSLQPDGANPVAADAVELLTTDSGIASFGLDPATGDILVADLEDGRIKRLVATPSSGGGPPATLAETGVFADLATLTPAAGVVPYAPNVAFWSDHATKRRWFALTDDQAKFGWSPTGNWSHPAGAVWIKHFDLELERGNPASARRIETRLLVKTDSGGYGLTYRWNDAQTAATLVPDDGAEAEFSITDDGATRTQTWRFPSRAECMLCHTDAGGFALSFNTRQLNRPRPAPHETTHQLLALAQAGYIDTTDLPDPATLPALAAADEADAPLNDRARAYLEVNCAQCHQPGATAPGGWDTRAATPLDQTGLVNGEVNDDGGNAARRLLVPGHPELSRILHAMAASEGAQRMPPVATRERDRAGEALVTEWITSLAPAPAAPDARLVNLATRAVAGSGGDTLIKGFVIGGDASVPGPLRILVRAAGPALAGFDVTQPLPDPELTLYQSGETLATNRGWSTAGNAAAIREAAQLTGAFPFPDGSADSALLVTLEPGHYSAHATSPSGADGIALIEVYDARTSTTGLRLINTSVRARVGSGEAILVPGLVIDGGDSRTVLIRAIGPGLAAYDIPDRLASPVLRLLSGQEQVAANTAWNTASNAEDIRATSDRVGAFALEEGSADSVLLLTLAAGVYTVQVSGANNTEGVALLEVYDVPPP